MTGYRAAEIRNYTFNLPQMRRSGFTMLELLVVMVIVSLLFGIASPLVMSAGDNIELKSSARQLVAALRSTRKPLLLPWGPHWLC